MLRSAQNTTPARNRSARLGTVPAFLAAVIVSVNCCHGGNYVAQLANLFAAANGGVGSASVANNDMPGQSTASCHSYQKSAQANAQDAANNRSGDHETCPECNRPPVVQDGQKVKLDQLTDVDSLNRARNFAALSHWIAPRRFYLLVSALAIRRLPAHDPRSDRTTGAPVYIFHQSLLI